MTAQFELGRLVELTQDEARGRALAELDPHKRVAFVAMPDDPRRRQLLIKTSPNGSMEVSEPIELPAPRLDVVVPSLGMMSQTCRTFAVQTLLVTVSGVTGWVCKDERLDKVRCFTDHSAEYRLVSKWVERTQFSQQNLVRMLRLELSSAVVDDTAKKLLKFAEAFSVSRNEQSNTVVKRDRESLGRSIDDQVKSEAGDCPDWIYLDLLVHRDAALATRRKVRVAVDFSPSTQEFWLRTFESDLSQALDQQLELALSVLRSGYPEGSVPEIVAGA